MREKETNSHVSKEMADKNKRNQQNQVAVRADYKLPLVWIDLEMTGTYLAVLLRKNAYQVASACLLSLNAL